jgi:hypothetical protein
MRCSRDDRQTSQWRITAALTELALFLASCILIYIARQQHQENWFAPNNNQVGSFLAKSILKVPFPHYMSTKEIFQEHFPQCLPSSFRAGDSESVISLPQQWLDWLHQTTSTSLPTTAGRTNATAAGFVQYVRSKAPPRYDHITCNVMKPRYNCAAEQEAASRASSSRLSRNSSTTKRKNKPIGSAASDYKFQWRQNVEDPWCDLETLIDFVQGPSSIISQRSVLLQGNSYLRQIWEAMVCGFRSQVTNLTLLSHGPDMSLKSMAHRGGKLFQKQEMGKFLINQQSIPGCHDDPSPVPLSRYYGNHVTVPPNVDHCSDDMAMVEFGNGLRVFYLFHPSRYESDAFTDIYSKLDVPESLDVMAWISDSEQFMRNRTANVAWSLDNLLPTLKRAQLASIGYVFGADNPWITNPPDEHPCLPGIPDDEANILLYLLLLEEYERTNMR